VGSATLALGRVFNYADEETEGESVVLVLTLLLTFAFPVAVAQGADWLDPSFGSGGVVTPALPAEASQKQASIVDLDAAPDEATVGALKGLGGTGYFGIVQLTPTGSPAPTFGTGGFSAPLALGGEGSGLEAQAEAVAVQGDGKVIVAGYIQQGLRNPLVSGPLLVRYLADGSRDPSFGQGGVVMAPQTGTVFHDVDLAPEGRILVAAGRGESLRSSPKAAGIVYAYEPDGTLDQGFGQGGRVLFSQRQSRTHTSLRSIEVLGNGKILVAGYRAYHPFLARLEPDGSLDRGFGGGDGTSVLRVKGGFCCPTSSLAVQRDGRIVVASNAGPLRKGRVLLIRYRPSGALDRRFGDRGIERLFGPWRLSEATDVAIQGDGGILTVGRGEHTDANPRGFTYAVFRTRPNGRRDRGFGNHGLRTFRYGRQSYAAAALAQPDGGVLTGGSFLTAGKGAGENMTTLLLTRFLG
jgi:uncharacterized delta-60 repeat protein